jgi:protease stability complex PrcB-like protein
MALRRNERGPAQAGPLRLAAVAAAAACLGTSTGPITFRTVAHASTGGVQPRHPIVIIATAATGARRIAALVADLDASRVRAVDLHARTLVAAFVGAQPSSGYGIQIRRLVLRGPVLDVLVALRTPGATSLPAFSSPYHVVSIARDRAASARRWRLVTTGGRVIAVSR